MPRSPLTARTRRLPEPAGPLSAAALDALLGVPTEPEAASAVAAVASASSRPLADRDLQLALALLYEPHFGDLPGVDPRREWDPALIALRSRLEEVHEDAVRRVAAEVLAAAPAGPTGPASPAASDDVAAATVARLEELTATDGPGELSLFLGRDATAAEHADHLAQRAVYHLRESDPQTFALPRIDGPAKAAFAALQHDEYGAGRGDRVHADLFAAALTALGRSTDVLDHLPHAEPEVLAISTTMAMFGLHRRLRGAAVGHLAAFEATSALPCRLIAVGARRLALPPEVADYYEEHVEADSVHEQVALHELCGGLLTTHPEFADDVLMGAAACLALDDAAATALLRRWGRAPAGEVDAA